MIVLQHQGMESVVGFCYETGYATVNLVDSNGVVGKFVAAPTVEALDSKFCEEIDWYLDGK